MGMCSVMAYEAILILPGQRAMNRLAEHKSITPEHISHLVSATGRTPESLRQKAAGAIVMQRWQQAQDAQKRYITSALHDSYGWLRLAFILRMMKRPHDAAQALEKSFITGRYERELMLSRLIESAALWNALKPWVRSQVLSDLATLWGRERDMLIHALPINQFWPLYRRALLGTPRLKSAIALRATPQAKQQNSPQ